MRLNRPGRRAWIGIAAATTVLGATAVTIGAVAAEGSRDGADPRLAAVMDRPGYRNATWGLLETDAETGRVIHATAADRLLIPGSTAKLFSVSGAWNALGGDHRFTTPVHAIGTRTGPVLDGDLVLVAQGDLTMGGRTRPDGTVAFTDVDHTYANDLPGATLTPENPLAGLDEIAAQVKAAGITQVRGDVVVDDRLFTAPRTLDPRPHPMIVNDNVVDLLTTPTRAGQTAALSWRPQVAPYEVTSTVRTVARGGPTDVTVTASPDGTRITLSGTIAEGSEPVLRVSRVEDPAAFGRAALVEALTRAGVTVTAPAAGPNRATALPAAYTPDTRVAAYVSPPYSQYARLILKVSHNLGANLAICTMATTAGGRSCDDGFPVLKAFLSRAGVDTAQVQLLDGRGGNPVDRATPAALAQLLSYWQRTPDAAAFRLALPILGVDGSLSASCTSCPAKGKVFAKTGTVAGEDALNGRVAIAAQMIAGYLVMPDGRLRIVVAGVNGASAPDLQGLLAVADDIAGITALLQEQGGPPLPGK